MHIHLVARGLKYNSEIEYYDIKSYNIFILIPGHDASYIYMSIKEIEYLLVLNDDNVKILLIKNGKIILNRR